MLIFLSSAMVTYAHPIISIITSVYNGDQFIEGFLEDITQQTIFDQCELILINANSPGNEEEIIKHYYERYRNIHYYRLDHDPGIYAVWNYAIKRAQGKYLTNANLDDRLKSDCYEMHKKTLDEYPEIDLVYSDFYVTYYPNETFTSHHASHERIMASFSPREMWQPLPNNHPMWRRSMHNRYGLFDERYKHAGDWEMWLRAVQGGAQFLKVEGIYGLYYYNPQGLSTNYAKASQIKKEESAIRKKYAHVFDNEKLFTD
jgi:glycosyltransferase involved in cell wall biosynthesis